MRSILLEAVLLLWLSSIEKGQPHPLQNKGSRLIIGTLVRLRRAAASESKAVTTEEPELMAATAPDNGGGEAVKENSKDSDDSLSGLDNKILLLMIVPPDKLKAKLMTKAKKKKLSLRSGIVSHPRALKAQCAAELQKKLEIAESLAKHLMTNSSMALLASQAETKNAVSLINKISDAIESKIKFVADVRPVINCEESCESTPKEVTVTTSAPVTTLKTTAPPRPTTTTSSSEQTSATTPCDADTTVKVCPEDNRKTLTPTSRKLGTPKVRVISS